jgi:hypothetical protein
MWTTKFLRDECGITLTSQFRRKLVVAQCDVFLGKALGVAHADNDGLWNRSPAGEKRDPLVGRQIDARWSA